MTTTPYIPGSEGHLKIDLQSESLTDAVQTAWVSGAIISPLNWFGRIRFHGSDTCSFLHNQLSSDLQSLQPTQAQYSSYCTPKGRMLATLLIWRSGEDYVLQLPRELLLGVQKRLSMYILRSKTGACDISNEQIALGIAGPRATEMLKTLFSSVPEQVLSVVHHELASILALPGERYQILVSPELAVSIQDKLVNRGCVAADPAVWILSEIRAAVPWITHATQEEWIPLMVNMDITGGVSFTKGCYPGQEIVARTHYLGQVKRRMIHARVKTDVVDVGQVVCSPEMEGQPSGKIILAAPAGRGNWEMLVVVQISSLAHGLYLGELAGPQLEICDLLALRQAT